MTRGIFIAGNESAISRAVEAETLRRVERFSVALIPNRFAGTPKNTAVTNEKRIALDWNPSSPISARTLVLAAENRMDHIDEALLICSPPSIRSSAAELPLADIEIMINDHIKGWFFLVKELASIFSSRQRGTLALVYSDISGSSGSKDDAQDILGPSSLASFRALTHGLLAAAHREQYVTAGFSSSDTGNEAAFAAFIFKNIDETTKRTNGKLHKFGKFSFFK
ncbi:MAG: hypothetical protein FWC03_02585 [Treponema sp.]|nr:hypothetical protein [Treponema sp.]